MEHVDLPDLGLRPTLRRLFPLWWEQRRLVALGLTFALAFTCLSITIPILIQRAVDEAIVGPQDERLLPYLGAILVLAALRFVVNFSRRFATARVGIAVEARPARHALPRLPHLPARLLRPARDRRGDLARDERHLPRPLLHRLGRRPGRPERDDDHRRGDRAHGRQRRLALYAALAMPPIAILTFIFAHRLFPISRLVQARKGNLAEATDEAVVGIEMVQAFGREDDVRTRFLGRAEAVRHETMRAARSRRTSSRPPLPTLARDRRRAPLRRPRRDLG